MVNVNSVQAIYSETRDRLHQLHLEYNAKYHEEHRRGIMRPQIGDLLSNTSKVSTEYRRFNSELSPAKVAVLLYSHTDSCVGLSKYPNLTAILEESKQRLLGLFD